MLKSVSSITNAIGALNFAGTWNASTNTPTLTSSVGTKGDYYVVGVSGSTTLNGISNWGVGDLATFNGSVWQRVEGGADLNGVNLTVSGNSDMGNIRIASNTISSQNTNGNIVLAPNGTGDVQVDADTLRIGDSGVNATIESNGDADLILKTGNATTGSVTLADGANGNLTVALNGTGQVIVNAGAVGTPTIAATGDLNTGMFFPAADQVAITTGGVQRTMVNAVGTLFIGKTSTNYVTPGISLTPNAASTFATTGNTGNIQMSSPVNESQIAFYRQDTGALMGYILNGASNTVAYLTTSDYRLKEDIEPMTGALAKVAALKPCTYKWKVDGSASQGFIAHELAEICPDAVSRHKDAVDADGNPQYQGIDTSFLVATLTAAIQEQQALITALTARVTALEAN